MVKIKNVKIVLPVEGTKSYKDILELLSDDNEYVLEKKESVKEVFKEYDVEGTPVYRGYAVMKEGNDDKLRLYTVKFSFTPDGYVNNEFELVPKWTIKKDLLEKIKQRFQERINKHPRLSFGDVDLGVLMNTIVIDENQIIEVRNPGQLLMFTNNPDVGETLRMSIDEYNEYLKKQKEKQLLEEKVEEEKKAVDWFYEQKQKEREKLKRQMGE